MNNTTTSAVIWSAVLDTSAEVEPPSVRCHGGIGGTASAQGEELGWKLPQRRSLMTSSVVPSPSTSVVKAWFFWLRRRLRGRCFRRWNRFVALSDVYHDWSHARLRELQRQVEHFGGGLIHDVGRVEPDHNIVGPPLM